MKISKLVLGSTIGVICTADTKITQGSSENKKLLRAIESVLTHDFTDRSTQNQKLLRETPFVLAHDSATGYVGNTFINAEISGMVKAQVGSFENQLNCGARALDLRLGYLSPLTNNLQFHHGMYYLQDQSVAENIPEVISWAGAHPSELVLLLLSHCWEGLAENGIGCNNGPNSRFSKPFTDLGIHVIDDRVTLADMTLEQAKSLAHLSNGGMVLAVFAGSSYIDSTFGAAQDITTEATGNGFTFLFHEQVQFSWKKMFQYWNNELSTTYTTHGTPWQLQAIWQETLAGIESEDLVNYNILQSTAQSNINQVLAYLAQNGFLTGEKSLSSLNAQDSFDFTVENDRRLNDGAWVDGYHCPTQYNFWGSDNPYKNRSPGQPCTPGCLECCAPGCINGNTPSTNCNNCPYNDAEHKTSHCFYYGKAAFDVGTCYEDVPDFGISSLTKYTNLAPVNFLLMNNVAKGGQAVSKAFGAQTAGDTCASTDN